MKSALRAVFVSAALVVVACGKRGDPRPPVPVIPKATSDLVVTQRGPKVVLSWSYPTLTTAGKNLGKIRNVTVYRYVEQGPVSSGGRDPNAILPGDIDPTVPAAITAFSKLPTLPPAQFVKLREKLDALPGTALAGATIGAKLLYEDTPSFHSKDGRPLRLTYGVVTEGDEAQSDVSNLVTIVPIEPPVAPTAVAADAKAAGVVLTWTAPARGVEGTEKPNLAGYNIYRAPAGQTVDQLVAPINTAPVRATKYTDVPPYGSYEYRVTALATATRPHIESELSAAVKVTYKDLLPPAAPANVTALIETKAVRLVWDAVDAPDLRGYRVYRTEGSGEAHKVIGTHLLFTPNPIKETYYRDTLPDPGIAYLYEVTAVDTNGNESAPVKTRWVLVPKTP
jgi:hypothetical protein